MVRYGRVERAGWEWAWHGRQGWVGHGQAGWVRARAGLGRAGEFW